MFLSLAVNITSGINYDLAKRANLFELAKVRPFDNHN